MIGGTFVSNIYQIDQSVKNGLNNTPWTYVNKVTLGSAASAIQMTSLDLGTNGTYYIVGTLYNKTTANLTFTYGWNADVTANHYYTSLNGAAAANDNTLINAMAGTTNNIPFEMLLTQKTGQIVTGFGRVTAKTTSDTMNMASFFIGNHSTTTNLTSFALYLTGVNLMDVGSYMTVFKKVY